MNDRRVRLVFQQPALPKYRVPFFRELARRPGIDLCICHARRPNLPNAPADGFGARYVPDRPVQVGGITLYWHAPQWQYAAPPTDVLVLTWDVHFLSLVPALLRARANGVPTILWGHGYSKQDAGWRRAAREGAARLATALVFYNRTVANRFIEAGWDPQRIHVAPNSIDQAPIQRAREQWLARPQELAAFASAHQLCPGPVLLFVARLDRERRVDLLLRAVAGLAADHPHLRAVIIGTGPQMPALKSLAASLGIAGRITFTGAVYDEQNLAPWFLSSTLMCFPSNMGLSLLHAFGYGLPVVTTGNLNSHGPEIEALRPGENGLFYRDGDAADLEATLRRALADRDGLQRMSREAHRTATELYSIERMADGMEGAVRYCLMQAGRKRRSVPALMIRDGKDPKMV